MIVTILIVLLILWLLSSLAPGFAYGPPGFGGSNIVYVIVVVLLIAWLVGYGPRRCEAPQSTRATALASLNTVGTACERRPTSTCTHASLADSGACLV